MKKFVIPVILLVIFGVTILWLGDFDGEPTADPEISGGDSRLAELLGSNDIEGYSVAIEPRSFRFPADHGPHPGFRNEWWYLTGNLDGEQGQRFGFELTFFRFSLSPGAVQYSEKQARSNWQTDQVYIAHFAVTDKNKEQFHVAQRFSRGALGLAGARSEPFIVWTEDWSVREVQSDEVEARGAVRWELTASDPDFALHLYLTGEKPAVLNGIDGLSQKSSRPGNASYYYSISRLRSEGTLHTAGRDHKVSGLSWLDREFRRNDGSQDPHSAGTWISREGEARHLSSDEVEIVITGEWESPEGGSYPSGWEISVPNLDLNLTVQPLIDDQELFTTVRYWEGAVDVTGERNHQAIEGRGYVELTGYAR
jgi:predicted secreted hydrolase